MLSTQTIGNKIAEARKQIHISQAELAQRMFISAQAVGKWERGESMPDITTFNRLAEILGVDLNYFSERFQTTTAESGGYRITPAEPSGEQSVEMPSSKPKKTHHWDMSRGNWADADFSGLKGLHEKFSSSNMQGCRFIGSDLSGLHLTKNNIASCDFSGSDVSGSHIQGSNLLNNIFRDCSLKDTEFSASNLEGCNFIGANFTGTEFSKSHLYGCDCTGADFTRAVFKSGGFEKNTIVNTVWYHTTLIDSFIADIVFDGTIEDGIFENCAFKKVTFRNAILVNTFFKTRSLKGIQFIDSRADRMTYEFLKSGKADLSGLTLVTG